MPTGRQADTVSLWMGKIGKTVNYINPAIDYGAKEPRAESIIPSN